VLAFALAFIIWNFNLDVLVEAFLSQPTPQKVAWIATVAASLLLLGLALWQSEMLLRQRKIAQTLEHRLRGVGQIVDQLEEAQSDPDFAAKYLLRTDPADAISAVEERLTSAEEAVQSQDLRNEAGDLQTRMEGVRERQKALMAKLGATLEKRHALEESFSDFASTQRDIEEALSVIERDVSGDTLEDRIRALTEFVTLTTSRCEEMERSMQTVIQLKGEFDVFQSRIAPLRDSQNGVKALLHGLRQGSAQLTATIDALDRDEGNTLSGLIEKMSETKRELSERVASLVEQFATLDTNHKDINALLAKLNTELKARSS
jgi:chromosome segregation ATPase